MERVVIVDTIGIEPNMPYIADEISVSTQQQRRRLACLFFLNFWGYVRLEIRT